MSKLINESVKKIDIVENMLGENYPASFDKEEFKNLTFIKKRLEYCDTHLKRISSGSSRTVYRIDDQKVLKLAHNKKGLAQNEVEIRYSEDADLDNIVAKVFDYNEDNLGIEMELAEKLTAEKFKEVSGFKWKDYVGAINNHSYNVTRSGYEMPENKLATKAMWEEQFTHDMFDYMIGYEVPVGDLTRLSSYGIVKREGSDSIIMVDYGLTKEVFNKHYSK